MDSAAVTVICDKFNLQSNLGALRNRQLRESAIVAAALSAVAVGLTGRGSLNRVPKEQITKELTNSLKRDNDRTAAQVMAQVLQTTTERLPVGEEVLIESTITEGVRVKPGYEAGGNPTIAVGALFGKPQHRQRYGTSMPASVTLLSMGNDVIEGTTKSVTGQHSSLTALFLTESNVKRHLPDIYVQRWMAGAWFHDFNPREMSLVDSAAAVAAAYGMSEVNELSAFFLDRKRHYPAMDQLNEAGITTPYDKDGDLFPAVVLGHEGISFPNGRRLDAMIGEIGGSAEWAVGVLPLVWRGGQAIGMLTSQSALSRKDRDPAKQWNERFNFTEDEFIMIQDARFEHKPHFTIHDILEDPFAGGIAAFGAITDNYYLPLMEGVKADHEADCVTVNVFVVNSMGLMECWCLRLKAENSLEHSTKLLSSPKTDLTELKGADLERAIGDHLADEDRRKQFRIFFNNEYYPAMIPMRDRVVMLHRVIDDLIERGALAELDSKIVAITERLAPEWFVEPGD
ncbi:MAG: fructose-bisphosphatase class II [candidate division Zixibacteria bacterium]|nr:fructose-bisphosphatase class II [candidate division Zixibacteria bacterium]MDH4033268.1 fructose-bisphosphatase class II [candidate division Zixibacteria bacterium]